MFPWGPLVDCTSVSRFKMCTKLFLMEQSNAPRTCCISMSSVPLDIKKGLKDVEAVVYEGAHHGWTTRANPCMLGDLRIDAIDIVPHPGSIMRFRKDS